MFYFLVLVGLLIPPSQDGFLPPESPLLRVNAAWDGTHHEDFIAAMHVPDPVFVESQAVYEEQAADVYRGMGNGTSDVEEYRPLVAGQFPPEQLENALCVIRSESGGNTHAKNPNSNARGLFQMMTSVWGPFFGWGHSDFYVPELNVYAAYIVWRDHGGWKPWSGRTRRNCGL